MPSLTREKNSPAASQVSEHASWSAQYHRRVLSAALDAAGAPADLVQVVTGYAEAGNAVVTQGVCVCVSVLMQGVRVCVR
eukprot:56645-Chlamydomonas_euryale.AAC.1